MNTIEMNKPIRGRLLKQIHLFVQAKPLSRPRIRSLSGTSQTYTPMVNQAEMMIEMCRYEALELSIPVIVDHYFYFVRFKQDLFPTSNKFGDLDNLVKAANDNLVRADILRDDKWIVGGEAFKSIGDEPMTVILIWEACVNAKNIPK